MNVSINEHGAVYLDGEGVGWVRDDGGCENERCLAEIARGDMWHAVPAGFGVTLPHYHYYYRSSAVAVLLACATEWVGDHGADCPIVKERRELVALMDAQEPGCDEHRYLVGAWMEYFAGGDQESEGCTCGRYGVTEGTRVWLAHDVERFPHFIARKGMTGTVTEASQEIVSVKMDETVAGAEEWDNELCWYPVNGDDPLSDIAPINVHPTGVLVEIKQAPYDRETIKRAWWRMYPEGVSVSPDA